MKAAAIYARVSTADQVKGTSLDSQLDGCRAFAKANGYSVIKEVAEDISGARLARKHHPDITGSGDSSRMAEVNATSDWLLGVAARILENAR